MKLTDADKAALIRARVEAALISNLPIQDSEDAGALIDSLKREGIKLSLGNPAAKE